MPTVYVLEPDSRLEVEYGRLLVTLDDEVILRVALRDVTQVVLVGRAGATTPAMHALLNRGIPTVFLDYGGRFLGRLQPAAGFNLPLRVQQFRRNDDASFSFNLAKAVVAGKIHNQYIMALRIARRHDNIDQRQLDQVKDLEAASAQAPDLDALLGMEGLAARLYFGIYRLAFDPCWKFENRNRRPPKDPANALLSLGYTLLCCNIAAALEVVGLDPYLGYFHAEGYGRPALALDLMEEFRAPIVDSLVLSLLNRRELKLEDFEFRRGQAGVYLNLPGRRTFYRKFSQKLLSRITVAEIGRPLSYQKLFEVQARKLARAIDSAKSSYHPFEYR